MIELHVHLDGSLCPATAMELAREQGVEAPTASLEEFTDRYMRVPENCPDLETCLKRFDIPIRVLSNPDAIGRATKELTEDLASEGFSYAEIRFAPQYARFTGYGQQEYVEAARSYGSSDFSIITSQILPNTMGLVIIQATMAVAQIILSIAALSYLGMGIQPPAPELGSMLSEGREYMRYSQYIMLFPGLMIALTALSLNLMGDGLRDALDPRLKN